MPRYEYRCEHGHVTELVLSMLDEIPTSTPCHGEITAVQIMSAEIPPVFGEQLEGLDAYRCIATAERVWAAPAAIHFKGPGFYATDVKGSQERRRRPNPGDSLPRSHDPAASAIARSL